MAFLLFNYLGSLCLRQSLDEYTGTNVLANTTRTDVIEVESLEISENYESGDCRAGVRVRNPSLDVMHKQALPAETSNLIAHANAAIRLQHQFGHYAYDIFFAFNTFASLPTSNFHGLIVNPTVQDNESMG